MTTLILDGVTRTLTVDSRRTDTSINQVVQGDFDKLFYHSTNRIVTGAGHVDTLERAAKMYISKDYPDDDILRVLHANKEDKNTLLCFDLKTNKYLAYSEMEVEDISDSSFFCSGSGAGIAAGALQVLRGKDGIKMSNAKDAMAVAVKLDQGTGGTIRTFDLELDPRKSGRKADTLFKGSREIKPVPHKHPPLVSKGLLKILEPLKMVWTKTR